jgi:60 kDa SS-A/Ro ribonucleoprotein
LKQSTKTIQYTNTPYTSINLVVLNQESNTTTTTIMPIKKSSTTNTSSKPKKQSAAAQAMAAQAAQATVIRNAVPQWFRIDPDQIPNNAGGFVWQISDKEQVIRYLVIGSEGGNFYQTPQQVSSKCASCVLRMTRTPDNFKWLIDTIRDVSTSGRAAKQESTLLALATAIVFAPTPAAKTEALNAVNDCVRILTHMYMLIGYIKIFSKAGHPSLATASTSVSNSNEVATLRSHRSAKAEQEPVAGGRNPPPVVTGSGLGRGIRRVFGEYFYSRTGIEIANLMTKYQNREGWNIKDVLTLIHINPSKMKDDGGRLAIDYVFKPKEEFEPILTAAVAKAKLEPSWGGGTPALLSAIKEIHTIAERPLQPALSTSTSAQSELDRIIHLINTVGLCREQLPSQLFKHKKVWEALLFSKGANGKGKGMPLTALIRNLGKLTTSEIGIIAPFSTIPIQSLTPTVKHICDRITDAADIKRTRIHPYTILVAMMTYKKGHGDKGGLTWSHNIHILEALDKAFKLAFQNITPTGKRIKIALDVSGSMSSAFCTGTPVVSCAVASVAMMMMTGFRPRTADSSALLTAPGASPPPAIGCATTVPESVAGGRNPLWKTTQLPDGRTLYENTKTNECQFTKPPSTPSVSAGGGNAPGATPIPSRGGGTPGRTPPTIAQYKATKKYLGYPDAQEPATASRPPPPHFGYSSAYYPPPPPYIPYLYPALNPPSNVTICAFSDTLTDITKAVIGYMDATTDPTTGLPTMTIDDALKLVELPFSATDCSLPMIQALQNKEQVDAFVIYTDNETYAGQIHPQVALEQYRAATGINAKLIVVGMTSNCLTIADPKDLNTLNLAGFDTATPRLINDFISGGVRPPTTLATLDTGAHDDTDEFVMLNAE